MFDGMPSNMNLTAECCDFFLAGGLDFWSFCCFYLFLAFTFADAVESVLAVALSPAPLGTLELDLLLFCDIVKLDEILFV
jgi:hypothetical protein